MEIDHHEPLMARRDTSFPRGDYTRCVVRTEALPGSGRFSCLYGGSATFSSRLLHWSRRVASLGAIASLASVSRPMCRTGIALSQG
jgi:hypothetical protein